MTKVVVDYASDRFITRYPALEDRWDQGDTRAINSIYGIMDGDGYSDFTVDFPIDDATTYYLLYAQYGTGGSFGYDNDQLEFIDLFRNARKARSAKRSLMMATGNSGSYIRDNGKKITVHLPWRGYCEHLDYIEVLAVTKTNGSSS